MSTMIPFLQTPLPKVIFTSSGTKLFAEYSPDDTPFSDDKMGVMFETMAMMEETMTLLRFNCPDQSCDVVSSGWGDLKRHVRRAHDRSLCDLCTRNKKIFSHEHSLFTQSQLQAHTARGDSEPDNAIPTGFTGHPACEFCRQNFYDSDALYEHCRDRHEQCFICVRNGTGRFQYYLDYSHLVSTILWAYVVPQFSVGG